MSNKKEPKAEPKATEPKAPNPLIGEFEVDGRKFRRFERNADGDLQVEYLD